MIVHLLRHGTKWNSNKERQPKWINQVYFHYLLTNKERWIIADGIRLRLDSISIFDDGSFSRTTNTATRSSREKTQYLIASCAYHVHLLYSACFRWNDVNTCRLARALLCSFSWWLLHASPFEMIVGKNLNLEFCCPKNFAISTPSLFRLKVINHSQQKSVRGELTSGG